VHNSNQFPYSLQAQAFLKVRFNMRTPVKQMVPEGRRLLAKLSWVWEPGACQNVADLIDFQDQLVQWLVTNRQFAGSETTDLFQDAVDDHVRQDFIPAGFFMHIEGKQWFLPATSNHRVIALKFQEPSATLPVVDLAALGFNLELHAFLISDSLQAVSEVEKTQDAGIKGVLEDIIKPKLDDIQYAFNQMVADKTSAIGANMLDLASQVVTLCLEGREVCPLTLAPIPQKGLAMFQRRLQRPIHLYIMDNLIAHHGKCRTFYFLVVLLKCLYKFQA
jgi:hypothetical protein